jgi:hypothetical protein
MPDTSPSAYTPTMAYMAMVTSSITLLFLGSMAFLFWLAGLTEEKEAPVPVLVADAPSSALAKPEGYETGG